MVASVCVDAKRGGSGLMKYVEVRLDSPPVDFPALTSQAEICSLHEGLVHLTKYDPLIHKMLYGVHIVELREGFRKLDFSGLIEPVTRESHPPQKPSLRQSAFRDMLEG